MIKKYKSYFIIGLVFISIEILLCLPILLFFPSSKEPTAFSTSAPMHQTITSYPNEKRGFPAYDTITGNDGWPHYRVFFWVPKTATNFVPYADDWVKTDVSSHGSVEKWSVVETQTTNAEEKLVFIFVPKTFVYLYGNDFEKVIHLRYR